VKILITGSIAGFIPGSFQAVYNGTKAFLDSFSFALREELRDTKVTVTCLMPGATETKFFERADMMDTSVGVAKKDDAAEVAKTGFRRDDARRRRRSLRDEEQDSIVDCERPARRRSCQTASQNG
jgi:short-subunit dehydrogenase